MLVFNCLISNIFQETVSQTTKLGAVGVPVGSITLNCVNIDLKVKEWSLKFSYTMGTECDGINGKHATMLETKLLRKLTDPFLLPFTDALYIQTTALGVKVCNLYLIFNKEKVFICIFEGFTYYFFV